MGFSPIRGTGSIAVVAVGFHETLSQIQGTQLTHRQHTSINGLGSKAVNQLQRFNLGRLILPAPRVCQGAGG